MTLLKGEPMEYKGIKLVEVTEPQIFNPPKPMLVWDSDNNDPCQSKVCAIVNCDGFRVITERSVWRHCAEIPEVLATYRELSVYHCNEWHNEYTEFYLKDEADKVIAELEENHKKEVGQLLALNREHAVNANWLRESMKQVIRRQKYKRCIAMAKMCGVEYDRWLMKKANAIGLGKDGVEYYLKARRKCFHYMRWKPRWLRLAAVLRPRNYRLRQEKEVPSMDKTWGKIFDACCSRKPSHPFWKHCKI